MLRSHAIQGASRISWEPDNQRAVIKKLMEENLSASHEEIVVLFEKEIEEKESIRRSAAEYCVTNAMTALLREPVEELDYKKMAAKAIANYVLPNGKLMLESKGKDCKKAGGWLIEIAKITGPENIVKDKLSLKEILKIWNKYRRNTK